MAIVKLRKKHIHWGARKTRSSQYCQPLTTADSRSRFLFAIQALERATIKSCKPIFDKAFYGGVPEYIHTDNGSPFANALSLRRMTQLSVWFMDLGITPVYSDPAHPAQNGRHERMHRDLKAASTRPLVKDLKAQQRRFNHYIKNIMKFNLMKLWICKLLQKYIPIPHAPI